MQQYSTDCENVVDDVNCFQVINQGKMGIIEKIKEIEFEMARTQKNKATGELHT